MAYERVAGPLGSARDDHLAALVAHTVANVMRAANQPYPFEQFLPAWAREERSTSDTGSDVDDLKSKIIAMNRAFGGSDRRGDPGVDPVFSGDPLRR